MANAGSNGTAVEVSKHTVHKNTFCINLFMQLCSMQSSLTGGAAGSEKETDMIREILMDTNPWLLGGVFATKYV